MDDRPHPNRVDLPNPIEPLIAENKVSSIEAMATVESTVSPDIYALPEHKDNDEATGDESLVTAQQAPYRMRESPAKSGVEDSKYLDLAERDEPLKLGTENSVSSKENLTMCNILSPMLY
jgi:hypothetical protein